MPVLARRRVAGYTSAMLVLQGLRKSYGSQQALAGLDLAVAAGEIVALLGPNGAGKSTTVRCVLGLQDPDAGSILVDGIDARANPAEAKRRIGYLPEVARLHEPLTPREHLLLKGRLFGMEDRAIEAAALRMLHALGLADRVDEPMVTFSKGMLQKVGLAGALLTGPRLLVLDEPFAGLDVQTTMVLKETMREFAARGGAVLYCDHLLDVVQGLAHRIAVLQQGALVACGTWDQLRARTGGSDLAETFRVLTHAADPRAAARELLG